MSGCDSPTRERERSGRCLCGRGALHTLLHCSSKRAALRGVPTMAATPEEETIIRKRFLTQVVRTSGPRHSAAHSSQQWGASCHGQSTWALQWTNFKTAALVWRYYPPCPACIAPRRTQLTLPRSADGWAGADGCPAALITSLVCSGRPSQRASLRRRT